ncbi:beta-phosphoglucomutase [Vagococcus sp. BWB3-3]|uniref:Beta-phosphoglucomutase n=1 Tax=Vagococcus allomyrinae TaxID=2794353 RepID=A0A940SYA9_9ENTE|nr:beta-phosphoglucomutase [Vagococcus allomyrinae]MBP1043198.1 beta-phosphoglucomutase [Vagococcus allomyrinae]
MKKGFIFDLDGVITDTAKYHYLAWKELARELGIEIDEAFNESLKGIDRLSSLERILRFGGQELAYTEMEKAALAAKKNAQYVELLTDLSPADLLPGIADFLAEAKKQQVPCAIASASKNAPMILEKLGVAANFKAIVDPATLKKGKPDPEIFLKAAEAIGLAPAEAVGFEDAQAGVEALNAAGIMSVGIVRDGNLTATTLNVTDLREISVTELLAY